MRTLLIQLLLTAVALWIASIVVPGVHLSSELGDVLIVALAFGLVNAIVRPVVVLISLPLMLVTLGLMSIVINAAMLMLTDRFTTGLVVDGFGSAVLGALVISIVNVFTGGGDDDR